MQQTAGGLFRSLRLVLLLDLVCVGLLVVLCGYCFREQASYYLRRNLFFHHPITTFPLFVWSLAALKWSRGKNRAVRVGIHLLAGVLLAGVFLACLFDETGAATAAWHFTQAFNPLVQVGLGKTLLGRCSSPYGLYPEFLGPLVTLGGLSVWKFTAVMGLLTAAAFLMLWVFLRQATANRLVAAVGFLALVFVSWFYGRTPEAYTFRFPDFCFQDLPVRLVVPAGLVLLGWRYFRRPGRWLYAAILVWLSVGLLWNPASGLPALLAWVSTLTVCAFAEPGWQARLRQAALHLGAAAATLAGVVGLYAGVTWLAHGAWPHLAELFQGPRLLSLTGTGVLPLDQPTTAKLVFLVYLAGLGYALWFQAARPEKVRAAMIFLLSALGLGLLACCRGVTSPSRLLPVWWPCFLLLTLLLDELAGRLQAGSRRALCWLTTAFLLWLVEGYAGAAVVDLPYLGDLISRQLPGAHAADRADLRQEVALLHDAASQGEGLLVLSPREAVLRLAADLPQVRQRPDFEAVESGNLARLRQELSEQPAARVFIDKEVFAKLAGRLFEVFEGGYEIVSETRTDYLIARACPLLTSPDQPRWSIRFKEGLRDQMLLAAPVRLGRAFSVEMVVKPAGDQVPNAALIGNHPGTGDYQGFVICHGGTPNVYHVVFGTGTRWDYALGFTLEPGRWSYLAVVVDETAIQAYCDGRLVASRPAAGLVVQESGLPLQIGDWLEGGRRFRGVIQEVRLLGRALTESEITRTAERVRQALP
jgi:hypothetical protein